MWFNGNLNTLFVSKITKFLVYAGLAVVLLVGLVEAVLWLALPVEQVKGSRLILNNRIDGFQEKVTLNVGADLSRKFGWSDPKNESAVRIVCLGGPATSATLQNAEQTWWGQLRRKLEGEMPGKKFEMAALSVESKGILYGAKWLNTYAAELQPDLVIAQYGVEDVLLHPESFEYDANRLEKISLRPKKTGLKGALLRSSQICRRISLGRADSRQKLQQKKVGQLNYYASILAHARQRRQDLDLVFKLERPKGRDPLAEYMDGLSSIVSTAREAGSKVILVGEPALASKFSGSLERSLMMYPITVSDPEKPEKKPEPEWVEGELFRYYRAGSEYAGSVRVPFVNLHTQIPQTAEYFLNEMILTDMGASKVAEELLPTVKEALAK